LASRNVAVTTVARPACEKFFLSISLSNPWIRPRRRAGRRLAWSPMTPTRHLILAGGFLGLCVIVVGSLARGGGLTPLRGDRAATHALLERREDLVPVGRTTDDRHWRAHLEVVERELERGHVDAAVRVWHDAYGAALESRSWESMIAVGDAFMAIGRASGSVRGARVNARDAYLTALIRARRERSVDGALRSAEAFRALGDQAIADHCRHVAAQLAAQQAITEF